MWKFIQRILNRLPKYKFSVWYNHHAHDRKAYPIIFDADKKYIDCKIGVKLVMGETKDGEKIYYKVVKYWRERPWADWLYETDCINCHMKFSHIEPKKMRIVHE